MASITINGPVVGTGVHNAILRDALFHSPVERRASATSYYVIEIGVREGEFTSWVGTWDQSLQAIEGAAPTSIMDDGRLGMRLKAGQAIVVKVTAHGTPASLSGARINFRLALVGGRDGGAKPLVASGVSVADPNARVALATLERQINVGGLAEWDDSVQLQDPVVLAGTGAFQGRLQRDSTTQLSLQRYAGNWIEVDGEAVSLGSSGLLVTTTDGVLADTGAMTATAPTANVTYHVYVSTTGVLRLSATAPTRHRGIYYLGTSSGAQLWRFVGWARTNASTQFVDTTTQRNVVNYYNRLALPIILTPGYASDNAATTYTTTSPSFTPANGGTGATGSYIANGEDLIHVRAFGVCENDMAGQTYIGIGDNAGAVAVAASMRANAEPGALATAYSSVPAAGYRTVSLLVRVDSGTGTYYADFTRPAGVDADPIGTMLVAEIMA